MKSVAYGMGWIVILMLINYTDGDRTSEVLKDDALEICNAEGLGIYEAAGGFCCLCHEGFYLASHCKNLGRQNEPKERKCLPCPFDSENPSNQTFNSVQNNSSFCEASIGEFYCEKNFQNTYRKTGTRGENARCICKEGHRTATGSDDVSYGCHRHSDCEPGFQPYANGNMTHDPLCEACPNGTFSSISSPTEKCKPWNECKTNETVEKVGTRNSDVVCALKPTLSNISENGFTGYTVTSVTTTESVPSKEGDDVASIIVMAVCFPVAGIFVIILIIIVVYLRCCLRRNQRSTCGSVHALMERQCRRSRCRNQRKRNKEGNGDLESPAPTEQYQMEEISNVSSQDSESRPLCSPPVQGEISEPPGEISESGLSKNTALPIRDPGANIDPPPVVNLDDYWFLEELERQDLRRCENLNSLPQYLKNKDIAEDMLMRLVDEQDTNNFLVTARMKVFKLNDTNIKDIKKENSECEKEVRTQLVNKIVRKLGSNLTPQLLFEQKYEEDATREILFNKFCEKIGLRIQEEEMNGH